MVEYIEKNEVQKRIASIATIAKSDVQKALIGRALYCIDHIPAADVAPVRHGRWEVVVGSDGKEHMVCTVCRKQQDLTGVFSYCPDCGANMDGDRDG